MAGNSFIYHDPFSLYGYEEREREMRRRMEEEERKALRQMHEMAMAGASLNPSANYGAQLTGQTPQPLPAKKPKVLLLCK